MLPVKIRMSNITIGRPAEKTKARLRARASQHGRSMEDEARLADAILSRFRRLGAVDPGFPARGVALADPCKP